MDYTFEHSVAVRMAGEIVGVRTVIGRCMSKKYDMWLHIGVVGINKLSNHAFVRMFDLRQAFHHNPADDGRGIRCV